MITKSILMTQINQSTPKTNWSKRGTAAVRNGTSNDCFILAKFTVPGPTKATFTSGKFRIYATAAIPSRTYRLRMLTEPFNFGKVAWDGRPASTATGQVDVTTAVAKNGYVEFDVTALLNSVSAGTKFYGFLIYIPDPVTENTARFFYTAKGSSKYGPVLEAEYSTAPRTPADLNPSEGRAVTVSHPVLQANYIDYAGSTELTGVRVKVHSSTFNPVTTATDFDSGDFATDAPEFRLADSSFTGITAGQTKYWAIQYKDGDNLWSPWSPVASFTRTAKGTVTILSPAAAPNDFVEESSPPFLWSFSGTQKSYQVLVYTDDRRTILANTGKLTSSVTGATPPEARLVDDEWYQVEVRIWDNVERANTPGDSAYASAFRRFQYRLTNTVTPMAGLTLTQVQKTPWAELSATRSTTPDAIDVFRDGVLIARDLDPADLLSAPETYKFTDRLAAPHTPHTWEMRAKVNSRTASGNSKKTGTVKPVTSFLSTLDGQYAIPFLNYSANLEREDGSTVVEIVNSDEPVTVYQGSGGWKGTFSGLLSGAVAGPLGTETARDHLAAFLKLRERAEQGRVCVLTWADQIVPGVLSRMTYEATVYNEEIVYLASFYLTERKGVLQ